MNYLIFILIGVCLDRILSIIRYYIVSKRFQRTEYHIQLDSEHMDEFLQHLKKLEDEINESNGFTDKKS